MGNTGSTSHGKPVSRREETKGTRSGDRGKGRESCTLASTSTHRTRKHRAHAPAKHAVKRPSSALLPPCKEDRQPSQLLFSPVVHHAKSAMVGKKAEDSVLLNDSLLLRSESASSKDTLAEKARAEVEEMSEMTLDTNSSCPLIGPRNITMQMEQSSEMPKSDTFIFGNDVNVCEEELLQRESSSVAELTRQQSFEGRMNHSVAIVEAWFAEQEKDSVATA